MIKTQNNYLIQVQQAKARFLTYDLSALLNKHLPLSVEGDWLVTAFLRRPYRIHRTSGNIEKRTATGWEDGNQFPEVLTLLDLICDSRPDRHLSGQWKSMEAFGQMFHRSLLEDAPNPIALRFDADPRSLQAACVSMGGTPLPACDIGYAIELFDGLKIGLQFWHGDEEFSPRIRYLWDENATMYLRYETMYYAVDLLMQRILELCG